MLVNRGGGPGEIWRESRRGRRNRRGPEARVCRVCVCISQQASVAGMESASGTGGEVTGSGSYKVLGIGPQVPLWWDKIARGRDSERHGQSLLSGSWEFLEGPGERSRCEP